MGKDNSTSWHDFTYDFDAVFADVSKLANDMRLRARNRIMEAFEQSSVTRGDVDTQASAGGRFSARRRCYKADLPTGSRF